MRVYIYIYHITCLLYTCIYIYIHTHMVQGSPSTTLQIAPNTFGNGAKVSVFVQSISSLGASSVSTCMCVRMYVCVYVFSIVSLGASPLSTCMYECTYVCMYAQFHPWEFPCEYMYVCMYACMHVCSISSLEASPENTCMYVCMYSCILHFISGSFSYE
jgi:hypothetical protein